MRIGRIEVVILRMLIENEGELSFNQLKDRLSVTGRFEWYMMGHDRWREIDVKQKSLVRATWALEEKGLIERTGHGSRQNNLSKVLKLKLTDDGKWNYLKKADLLKS